MRNQEVFLRFENGCVRFPYLQYFLFFLHYWFSAEKNTVIESMMNRQDAHLGKRIENN